MALTKEHLQLLVSLQQQDNGLDKMKSAMDKIPLEIQSLRDALEGGKAAWNAAKAHLISLEKQKKEKELELGQKEETIRKHSTQLNLVKTNEAFKALQNEIDAAKREGGQLETDILEIMEGLDAGRREEKARAAEVKVQEDKTKAEISALEARLAEVQSKFDAAKGVRDQAAAPIPPDVMRVYTHVRARGKNDAVVAIDGNLCSACRITLAPQVIVEVTKAKQLMICESCQRILYRVESAVGAK